MTTEEVASEAGGGNQPLSVARVLDLCDRILQELGRRQHLFSWLRAPDAGRDEWLKVDAYYPGNQLLVVWHERPGPHDQVYSELVPGRGLRLLQLTPSDIDGDLEGTEMALRRRLAALGPAPRRAIEPVTEQSKKHGAFTLAPVADAAVRSRPVGEPTAHPERVGAVIGFALAVILLIETYTGVVDWGLNGGHLVLAFGLAIDVCARALGTIAAERAGEPDWAWWCALVGSPVVARFVLAGDRGPVTVEPAPLAGVLSCLALVALTIALLAAVL